MVGEVSSGSWSITEDAPVSMSGCLDADDSTSEELNCSGGGYSNGYNNQTMPITLALKHLLCLLFCAQSSVSRRSLKLTLQALCLYYSSSSASHLLSLPSTATSV